MSGYIDHGVSATAMQQALIAAMPEARERTSLARQIDSAEQLLAMPKADLDSLYARHEAECVSLAGRIEAAVSARGVDEQILRARRALQTLTLHKNWIERELAKRREAAALAEAEGERAVLVALLHEVQSFLGSVILFYNHDEVAKANLRERIGRALQPLRRPPAHLLDLRDKLADAVAARPGSAPPLRTCDQDERAECENAECRRRGACQGRFL